jgi:hypothetical protein
MQIDLKELLSRFLFDKNIRQDFTIRHDSFLPPPSNLELSVTRHFNFSENELWNLHSGVVNQRI